MAFSSGNINNQHWIQNTDTMASNLETVQAAASVYRDTDGNHHNNPKNFGNQHKGMDPDAQPKIFKRQSSFRMNQSLRGYNSIDSQRFISGVDLDPVGSYFKRLKTFDNWPRWACADPEAIALAGMSFIGEEDKAQCDFCRGILYSWDYTDQPLKEHAKHFDLCQFIQGRSWEVVQQYLQQGHQRQAKEIPSPTGQTYCSGNINTLTLDPSPELPSYSETNDHLDRVVHIVKSMGYGDNIIQKAIKILLKSMCKGKIKSDNLLDCIFGLEEEGYESDNQDDNLSEQVEKSLNMSCDNVLTSPQNKENMLTHNSTDTNTSTNDESINSFRFANCALNPSTQSLSNQYGPEKPMKVPENVTQKLPNKSCSSLQSSFLELDKQSNDLETDGDLSFELLLNPGNPQQITTQGDKQSVGASTDTSNCNNNNGALSSQKLLDTIPDNKEDNKCTRSKELTLEDYPSKKLPVKPMTAEESAKIGKLVEQRDNLQKSVMCNICNSKKIELLFLPCRHMIACDSCGAAIESCLICSQQIVATVRIYLS